MTTPARRPGVPESAHALEAWRRSPRLARSWPAAIPPFGVTTHPSALTNLSVSGGVAQLAERYVRNVEAVGSNPITSTIHLVGSPRESSSCWTFASTSRVTHGVYGRISRRVIKIAQCRVMHAIPRHPGDTLHVCGLASGRGGGAVGCSTQP
jgi:hypothetical protein